MIEYPLVAIYPIRKRSLPLISFLENPVIAYSDRISVCPCGSGSEYQMCCEVMHKNRAAARTPEQLMRARYSAFALDLVDFLAWTQWPADKQSIRDRLAELIQAPKHHWVALDVMASERVSPDEGYVEFKAFYADSSNVTPRCLHEKSRFLRVQEKGVHYWYYVDGVFPSNG